MTTDPHGGRAGADAPPLPKGWRLWLGFGSFGLSLSTALFIPLVAVSDLSAEAKATLSGLLIVGIPQLLMLLAVVALGKPGFAYLKSRVGQVFARFLPVLKLLAPADTVSGNRYRIGLVLFVLPLLVAFVGGYDDGTLARLLGLSPAHTAALFDIMFVASFFVLGGDFWDKVRALFVHKARATFSDW